jgi:SAM-dependent methyltransferase
MPQGTEIYNDSADELSDYYDRIGPRYGDIELAFADAGNPENAIVLEIGCSNGRDAQAITEHTPYYTGIDTSEKMLAKARERLPEVHFEQADAITYEYPNNLELALAFGSPRHFNLEELTTLLRKVYDALRVGGIFYISSNYGEKYEEGELIHSHGTHKIYYYNPDIILNYAPRGFKKIRELRDEVNNEPWFELSLKKTF